MVDFFVLVRLVKNEHRNITSHKLNGGEYCEGKSYQRLRVVRVSRMITGLIFDGSSVVTSLSTSGRLPDSACKKTKTGYQM